MGLGAWPGSGGSTEGTPGARAGEARIVPLWSWPPELQSRSPQPARAGMLEAGTATAPQKPR